MIYARVPLRAGFFGGFLFEPLDFFVWLWDTAVKFGNDPGDEVQGVVHPARD